MHSQWCFSTDRTLHVVCKLSLGQRLYGPRLRLHGESPPNPPPQRSFSAVHNISRQQLCINDHISSHFIETGELSMALRGVCSNLRGSDFKMNHRFSSLLNIRFFSAIPERRLLFLCTNNRIASRLMGYKSLASCYWRYGCKARGSIRVS